MLVLLAPFAIAGGDPGFVMGAGSGIGTAGVLILMALVSLAVPMWFCRNDVPTGERKWKVHGAPIVSLVILGAVVVFAIVRFDPLVGGAPGQNLWMLHILLGVLVAGCVVARYFKRNRPQWFATLGRAVDEERHELVRSERCTELPRPTVPPRSSSCVRGRRSATPGGRQ